MDQDPNRTALREARRLSRVNCYGCAFCGCRDRAFEWHHPFGVHHDPRFKIPVCFQHHRMLTEGQLQGRISLSFEPNANKRVVCILEAEIAFMEDWIKAKRRVLELLRQTNEAHNHSQSTQRNSAPPPRKSTRKS
jgi:hypothetical protein